MKLIRHSIIPGGASCAPFAPPPLDAASAHASRRLFDARLPAFLRDTLDAGGFRCGFATGAPDYADPAIAELRIDTPAGPVSAHLSVDLERYPALAVCAWSEAQAADRRTSPELTLRNAVANVLCGPLLQCLDTLGLPGVQVVAVRRGVLPPASPGSVTVALSLVLHGQRHDARVRLPGRCIEWLDTCVARTARPVRFDASLRVPGSLVLGTKPLSVDTLQSLRGGDILMRALDPALDAAWLRHADDGPAAASPPVALAAWGSAGLARCHAAVAVHPRTITLLKEPVMTESTVLGAQEAGPDLRADERAVEVGELELPVQFVADTVALTIDEVSSLAPGYVIELPTAIADLTLKLVAHGQVIGHGELVGIGEHVGIRILRMAHEHDPVQ
ncbi:type III secretion-associated protein [Burkholderia lata]|uniref:Type III secretion-associated protein n=1 Tax=Burkholderia lata (strain ATCC 17760 / DSM 23089 / LMG 22485 / NCIMB 9086 / R18194 / 383) TaxID=482957 RepID=A0A6P2T3H0_BURL3|nr:type III secretion system cytoplasmic ring protein SctQ [Burkholderia lata]VWC56510.1 type III secretion-associated protein [Burkholderia lata]